MLSFRGKLFGVLVFLMLAAMAAIQVRTVLPESQTIDESNQLVTGYAYLKTGRYTLGLEHPPLLKLLLALPVLSLNPHLPSRYPGTPVDGGDPLAGIEFLYRNTSAADTMLFRARMAAIGISLLLGACIAFWAKRWFGAKAALLAVFFYAFDPNFIAHGRYIKNDVGLTLMFFLTTAAWGEFLLTRKRRYLWYSGIFLGMALATKFSAALLIPVMVLLSALHWFQIQPPGEKFPWRAQIKPVVLALCMALPVVWATYRFDVDTLEHSGLLAKARKLPVLSALTGTFGPAWRTPVPGTLFLRGITAIAYKNAIGREDDYLLGKVSRRGWWYCSLVVFLVKTPVAVLALCALVAILVWRRIRWDDLRAQLRALPFPLLILTVPAACYWLAGFAIRIHEGMRHLLPVFPFLYIFLAAFLMLEVERGVYWIRVTVAGAVLLLLFELWSIYPHPLAFFNFLAGGPAHGPRYLLGSNIDSGQEAKRLKTYLAERGVVDACVSYNGFADLDYYKIPRRPLPPADGPARLRSLDCLVAISVSNLYPPASPFRALLSLEPDARIGYSIYIYDLRKTK